MNLLHIINEIEKADPEVHERMSPRRDAIRNITKFGSRVAIAAAPFAFSALFKKAYSATTPVAVNDVLNFALQLEYLELYFYNQGLAAPGLVKDVNTFQLIQADEKAHVAFLLSLLGNAAVAMPKFDLTAKGAFPDVLTNYNTFMEVANAFEDTGVRAYKGQAANLYGQPAALLQALSIHAVEARHAAIIRYIRNAHGVAITPWITGSAAVSNDTGAAAFNANYAGENNVTQNGINITTLPSAYGAATPYNLAAEAFDEPLTMAAVLNIVSPFFA